MSTTAEPSGCLACNYDDVAAFLRANGVDPARLVPAPPTRHRWSDVTRPCQECGAVFLLLPQQRSTQ